MYSFVNSEVQTLAIDGSEGNYSSAVFSPCGDMMVLGGRNTLTVFQQSTNTTSWNKVLNQTVSFNTFS